MWKKWKWKENVEKIEWSGAPGTRSEHQRTLENRKYCMPSKWMKWKGFPSSFSLYIGLGNWENVCRIWSDTRVIQTYLYVSACVIVWLRILLRWKNFMNDNEHSNYIFSPYRSFSILFSTLKYFVSHHHPVIIRQSDSQQHGCYTVTRTLCLWHPCSYFVFYAPSELCTGENSPAWWK